MSWKRDASLSYTHTYPQSDTVCTSPSLKHAHSEVINADDDVFVLFSFGDLELKKKKPQKKKKKESKTRSYKLRLESILEFRKIERKNNKTKISGVYLNHPFRKKFYKNLKKLSKSFISSS